MIIQFQCFEVLEECDQKGINHSSAFFELRLLGSMALFWQYSLPNCSYRLNIITSYDRKQYRKAVPTHSGRMVGNMSRRTFGGSGLVWNFNATARLYRAHSLVNYPINNIA
jgi:hypothetical protein